MAWHEFMTAAPFVHTRAVKEKNATETWCLGTSGVNRAQYMLTAATSVFARFHFLRHSRQVFIVWNFWRAEHLMQMCHIGHRHHHEGGNQQDSPPQPFRAECIHPTYCEFMNVGIESHDHSTACIVTGGTNERINSTSAAKDEKLVTTPFQHVFPI